MPYTSFAQISLFSVVSHDTILHHYFCILDQHLKDATVHGQLVKSGRAWGDHINEPWNILVCVGVYIIFSVGFDITICALCGDAVLAMGQFNTHTLTHTLYAHLLCSTSSHPRLPYFVFSCLFLTGRFIAYESILHHTMLFCSESWRCL